MMKLNTFSYLHDMFPSISNGSGLVFFVDFVLKS